MMRVTNGACASSRDVQIVSDVSEPSCLKSEYKTDDQQNRRRFSIIDVTNCVPMSEANPGSLEWNCSLLEYWSTTVTTTRSTIITSRCRISRDIVSCDLVRFLCNVTHNNELLRYIIHCNY